MKLPTLAELGTAKRGDPCREYPGTYHVYHGGQEMGSFSDADTEESARTLAYNLANETLKWGDNRVSVCWEASHNDPRIGQVWFTGFYQLDEWK